MRWSDGPRSVSFRDCILGDINPTLDAGTSFRLAIYDRRWKLQFGQVSGQYNVWKAGERILAQEKTPQQLATLAFDAAGVDRFDVSRMPTDVYPKIEWDVTTPADALNELLDITNCYLCLTAQDKLVVFPDGVGAELPRLPFKSYGTGIKLGNIPDKIGVTSAPFMWQKNLKLVPVGKDNDEAQTIKPIDDLSYKPAGGWGSMVHQPDKFLSIANKCDRKLAVESVWRWYRVDMTGFESLFHVNQAPTELRQILPLLDFQLAKEKIDLSTGEQARRKPVVYGVFYDRNGVGENNVTTFSDDISLNVGACSPTAKKSKLIFQGQFEIDNERGIVKFGDPMFKLSGSNFDTDREYEPADIRLRIAINFRNKDTLAAYRQFRELPVPGVKRGTKTLWVPKEDLFPEWRVRHSDSKTFENTTFVDQQLVKYVRYELAKFTNKLPSNASYPMLVPMSPDGRIAQVTYSIDGSGKIGTSMSRDGDELGPLGTYQERKLKWQIKASVDQAKRNRQAKKDEDDRP